MPCTHVISNGAQRRVARSAESRVLSLLDLLQHGLQIPLFARNDIIGQHCLVESEFCQRITQYLQFRRKPESIFTLLPDSGPVSSTWRAFFLSDERAATLPRSRAAAERTSISPPGRLPCRRRPAYRPGSRTTRRARLGRPILFLLRRSPAPWKQYRHRRQLCQ